MVLQKQFQNFCWISQVLHSCFLVATLVWQFWFYWGPRKSWRTARFYKWRLNVLESECFALTFETICSLVLAVLKVKLSWAHRVKYNVLVSPSLTIQQPSFSFPVLLKWPKELSLFVGFPSWRLDFAVVQGSIHQNRSIYH